MNPKFTIPDTLKIAGHEYKVLYPYKFRERSDLLGQCDHSLKEIRISDVDETGNDLPDTMVLVTFIHEVMHVADEISGHNMFMDEAGEKALCGISEVLFQIFKDNF